MPALVDHLQSPALPFHLYIIELSLTVQLFFACVVEEAEPEARRSSPRSLSFVFTFVAILPLLVSATRASAVLLLRVLDRGRRLRPPPPAFWPAVSMALLLWYLTVSLSWLVVAATGFGPAHSSTRTLTGGLPRGLWIAAASINFVIIMVLLPSAERPYGSAADAALTAHAVEDVEKRLERLTLRSFGWAGRPQEGLDETACTICLGDYELEDQIRQLVCGHAYHVECIDQWLSAREGCPMRCQASPRARRAQSPGGRPSISAAAQLAGALQPVALDELEQPAAELSEHPDQAGQSEAADLQPQALGAPVPADESWAEEDPDDEFETV